MVRFLNRNTILQEAFFWLAGWPGWLVGGQGGQPEEPYLSFGTNMVRFLNRNASLQEAFFGWLAGLAGWLAGWLAGATGGALDIGDLRNTQSSQGIPRDGARTYHVRCIVHDLDSTQPVHHGLVAKLLDAATTENRGS